MIEGWMQNLKAQQVQFLILSQGQDNEWIEMLTEHPEWSIDFEGDGTMIFVCTEQDGGKIADDTIQKRGDIRWKAKRHSVRQTPPR